ncbi:MAG: ribokinase [Ruminococcaceae bacterium]|nr:ribokinase [Oscillospiraceae bacterium]
MGKVIGPGSLIVDVAAYAKHLPVDGETVMGSSLKLGPGGKGSNQLTAAKRAGAEAIIIGAVGTDSLSSILTDHYAREQMSTKYMKVSETSATGAAVIEIDEISGQNRIIIASGASMEVVGEDVLKAEEDFVDCGVVLCQFETSLESILEAKRLAKKYDKPFILNPAPFMPVPEEVFDGVDYLTPNETEAEFFTGVHIDTIEDAKRAAEILLAKGVKKVILTLGKKGSFYYDGEHELHLPCLPLKAVDTTGAGDAFSGALAAAISEGLDDETALKFATCTSNISVTRKGSSPSMPYRHEILALMKESYGIEL